MINAVLQQVKDFAAEAHQGQQRKYSPEPFIAHPIRVMEMSQQYEPTLPVAAAALLHDVLEDTAVDQSQLQQFLNSVMEPIEAALTLTLVVELTDVYIKADFPKWNRRKRKLKEADRIAATSAAAQTIKYADIIDNCRDIIDEDPEFALRFLKECRNLLKRMPKGHPDLYQKAIETVDSCLHRLQTEK